MALLLAATATTEAQEPQEIWPADFFSDLPAVDLSGTWVLDPERGDATPGEWQDREVRYLITQGSAHIELVFEVGEGEVNTQTYRWDNAVEHFERDGREIEEAAHWVSAGRRFEVVGRHWSAEKPAEKVAYRLGYSVRGDELTFVQESEGERTVWHFRRHRTGVVRLRPAPAGGFDGAP